MRRCALLLVCLTACGRLGFTDHEPTPPDECTLALDAGAPRLNFHSRRAIQASGGSEPIAFVLNGTGTIDALGVVTADHTAGLATITATDAGECTAQASLEIGGDMLWYVGGSSSAVPSPQVWKSTDGHAWTLAGALPDKRTSGGLLVFHDKLWWISGSDGVGERDEVWWSEDGVTWTLAGHVPMGATNFGHAVFKDQMWMVGGGATPDIDTVYASGDGATWQLIGTLPTDNHGGASVVADGKLWYLGGHDRNTGMLFDWALSTSTGASWQQVGSIGPGREYASALDLDGTIILAGGQDLTPTQTTSVIGTTTGTSFMAQPPLPVARAFGSLARFGGRLWSIGGTDGGAVFEAVPGGAWATPVTNFPVPRTGGKLAVFSAVR